MSNPSCLKPRHSACIVQAVVVNLVTLLKQQLFCLTIKTSTVAAGAGGAGVTTSCNWPPFQTAKKIFLITSHKWPPLVSVHSHFLGWRTTYLSLCAVCSKPLRVIRKKLSVTARNYSCKSNLEVACSKIYSLPE